MELPGRADRDSDTILQENTIVCTSQESEIGVVILEDDLLVINQSYPSFADIQEGFVLVSDEFSKARFGYALKVQNVEETDGQKILTTTPASLLDIFEQADFKVDLEYISTSDAINLRTDGSDTYFEFEVNSVIYDQDGDLSTTNDQITIKGIAKFRISSPSFEWKRRRGQLHVEKTSLLMEMEDLSEFQISIGTKAEARVDWFTYTIPFTFTVPGLVVPIYLPTDIKIGSSAEIELDLGLTGEFKSNGKINAGFLYNAGSPVTNLSSASFDPTFELKNKFLSVSVAAAFYPFDVKAEIKPYHLEKLTATLGGKVGIVADAEISTQALSVDVYVGSKVYGEIEIDFQKWLGINTTITHTKEFEKIKLWSETTPFGSDDPKLLPVLTTRAVSEVTFHQAISGGTISSQGSSMVTGRGVCWSTSPNPTIDNDTTSNGSGPGSFTATLGNLQPETTYFLRAYATNLIGTSYGNELSFTTPKEIIILPTVLTGSIQNISTTDARIINNIISNTTNSFILQRGIVYSTNPNPTTEKDMLIFAGTGTGSFDATLTDLKPKTRYYVKAFAIASNGTAYGNEISFTTKEESMASGLWPEGYVHCNDTPTEVVDVTNPVTGRTWMDRNLGASRAANSSTDELAYGDLYQWGRGPDGHQCRNSRTTTELSSFNQVGHGDFIISTSGANFNWRRIGSTTESLLTYENMWQGINDKNNPCPEGFRLPSENELQVEINSWVKNIPNFGSILKLTFSGARAPDYDEIIDDEDIGIYWSSTTHVHRSRALFINKDEFGIANSHRGAGLSVRCIKN
ncbi:hypothetical protein GCM10008106_37080 [Mongoliitalea lutea]|uniref:Fibronectin type-III domain-containing protein n=2 Tax=Mongoliitalea lutea TaxID=849756 RepID=A0A8J3D0T9_9BACT|nr:hypothetical protein GCM10008106_37080 [Mongoliitalea lutea]